MGSRFNRGNNEKSYGMYEELTHLKVSPESESPYIYKRLDKQLHLPIEERTYQLRIPVSGSKGVRKSLGTSDRKLSIERSEEMVMELRVLIKQGGSPISVSVEEFVKRFLKTKKVRVRGKWEGKEDRGKRSITGQRYELIEGKLRNYFIRFLGDKTDIRTIPLSKWNTWEVWRIENNTRKEMGKPKSITIQNEMGMIREIWRWGMENSYIPNTPKLPFHDENLIGDDKVRRDTWEPSEWSSFSRKVREWLKEQQSGTEEHIWDSYVSYQMMFFLSNTGMRVGELVKVRRKDVQFYQREGNVKHKNLCCLIQVHKSTKTGSREVNGMGGIFLKRVFDKSKFKNSNDFVFCRLDGSQFTTKKFRDEFVKMITYTNENERWGKSFVPYSLRHLYCSIRLQNGTSIYSLSRNMGVTEPYIRKHYSHYLTRLGTEDLMRVNKEIGLGGRLIPKGEDFMVPDMTE